MDSRSDREGLTVTARISANARRTRARPSKRRAGIRILGTYGDARAENLLVKGDNLAAMTALTSRFEGRFRCAYLDPPFNTGRAFEQYDDARRPEEWLAFMRPRLEALRTLLSEDGAVFVEIDDTQLAPLVGLLDEIFGARNRISTITIVRSAPTGHKAINLGPVHVSDFLLVYAKNRRSWRYRPQVRVREGFDKAYSTWLENPDDTPARWRFRPLKAALAEAFGFASVHEAKRALGQDVFLARVYAHALEHARQVVRFAQPRYEAISEKARRVVDRSRAKPEAVFVLEREGRSPFIVRGANRILFLADKVRVVDGRAAIVEALTNVWDDVPFQGIAREGGVVFSRNKKPERLVARVLAMSSDEGDWVIDPFLGSGTTAAVAHKMKRRWVGIEAGEHASTLAEPRLRRVVDGADATGITTTAGHAAYGGFVVASV